MTFPILDRARKLVWVVTGAEKRLALARLLRGDTSIPAGRIRQDRAMVIRDTAAGTTSTLPSQAVK
jgi:6-phosphogluconolactonase